jgi:hypothetical protein
MRLYINNHIQQKTDSLNMAVQLEEVKSPSRQGVLSPYNQEFLLRVQTEKQRVAMSELASQKSEWFRSESHLLGKLVVASSFSEPKNIHPEWEIAQFLPGGQGSDPAADVKGSWENQIKISETGLHLQGNIIRTKIPITLRSIGVEIKIQVRLYKDSTLWLFTRGLGVKDPNTVICKIRKEQESHRVFLIFGGPIGPNFEFKFFKKQEVPEFAEVTEDSIIHDYIDIKLKYVDNGDDKAFVQLKLRDKEPIIMTCNKFVPIFRECPIMIAGSGHCAVLKYIDVVHVERVKTPSFRERTHYECCSII